jgi:outer membrane immunogenic protein
MRRSIITSALAVGLGIGLGAAAFAAPPPPPVYSWTGFYVGGNAGGGWANSDTTMFFNTVTPPGSFISSPHTLWVDGFIGGGQAGYNWQSGNWVAGQEADFQGSTQKGNSTFECTPLFFCGNLFVNLDQKLDWFGTVRGRLGWTFTPTSLVYATGGLAYGKIDSTVTDNFADSAFTSVTNIGWTVGAGIEDQLSGNWTWKLEYLYMDLGSVSGVLPTHFFAAGVDVCDTGRGCPITPAYKSTFTDSIVRVGINYRWQ